MCKSHRLKTINNVAFCYPPCFTSYITYHTDLKLKKKIKSYFKLDTFLTACPFSKVHYNSYYMCRDKYFSVRLRID